MCKYEIRILGIEYVNETLALFNQVFHLSKSMDFWMNKHYKNPLGESIFVGVFDNQCLVAMNAYMPIYYTYNTEVLKALESCESAVNINYRHQGLFSKIMIFMEEWAQEQGYDFLVGYPNIYSYPGFIKLGWEVVNTVEAYGRIANLQNWILLKRTIGIRPLADTLLIFNYVKNRIDLKKAYEFVIKKINIDEFMLNYTAISGSIKCHLSTEFLKWKLSDTGNIYILCDAAGPICLIMTKENNIVYFDCFHSSEYKVSRAIKFFCRNRMNACGLITIYIDSNYRAQRMTKMAGFVDKREPKQTKIIKRLSSKMFQIDSNIVWVNQMIEGD